MSIAITVKERFSTQEYSVIIEKNKSIQIDCTYMNAHNPKPTSVTFKVGNKAEYDSYNLSYIGTILAITEKTILMECGTPNQPEKRRLKLDVFCWRNWNFNLEKVLAYNQVESQYI